MFSGYSYVFLDFDGVIKESVEVKSDAFESLFMPFGEDVACRIRRHHERNSGISRYEKLPIYLEWAGQEYTEKQVAEWGGRFSVMVKQRVIDSAWVPGILEFLKNQAENVRFFVITATPQAEIDEILVRLGISHYISAVIGAPTPKEEAIQSLLWQFSIHNAQAVMVGDAGSDHLAAKANQIDFILRRTELNLELQETLDCVMINDFIKETVK